MQDILNKIERKKELISMLSQGNPTNPLILKSIKAHREDLKKLTNYFKNEVRKIRK